MLYVYYSIIRIDFFKNGLQPPQLDCVKFLDKNGFKYECIPISGELCFNLTFTNDVQFADQVFSNMSEDLNYPPSKDLAAHLETLSSRRTYLLCQDRRPIGIDFRNAEVRESSFYPVI